MLLTSILKTANANGTPTTYVKGRALGDDETFQREGKLIVFESGYGSLYDTKAAKFEIKVDYGAEPKIYHLRNVEVLAIEGYAVFMHLVEPTAAVYKLDKARNNTLTDIQTYAASIFGLENAKPFAIENSTKYFVDSNSEWEDFLCAMTARGLIDEEETKILYTVTVSAV